MRQHHQMLAELEMDSDNNEIYINTLYIYNSLWQ